MTEQEPTLRDRAERSLSSVAASPGSEQGRLRHELDGHGVELELQSEELRRTQAELQAARDRYFLLYDGAPVGYLTLDPSGAILEANARAAALIDVEPSVLVGSPLGTHVLAEGPVLATHLREVFAAASTRVCELAVKTRAGQRRSLRAESLAVVGGEGPAHCRMVLVDVTAIVEADTKRRQLEETLRRREEELVHLQRLETLGTLTARMAHEYRNLFGAMKWSVTGAAQEAHACASGDCRTKPHLERLKGELERANALATQMLALGRKQKPQQVAVEVDAAIAETESVLKSLLGGGGIDVVVTRDAAGAWFLGGTGWLEQIVLNLAMNGRDAMPAGGRLAIASRKLPARSPEARPEVVIEVADSGAGMFPETLAKVFEPYFTTKKGKAGTGLGLSTVRDLITRVDGKISVASQPGRGTTFTVTLPCCPAPPPKAPPPTTPNTRSTQTPAPGEVKRQRTVLVVEDEPLLLRTFEHYLRAAGHRLLLAGSAQEALDLLERHKGPVDLLLTDVNLPESDGRSLSRSVRARHPSVEVLFMSAMPREHLLEEGKVDATSETIEKPFSAEDLSARIRELFDKRRLPPS